MQATMVKNSFSQGNYFMSIYILDTLIFLSGIKGAFRIIRAPLRELIFKLKYVCKPIFAAVVVLCYILLDCVSAEEIILDSQRDIGVLYFSNEEYEYLTEDILYRQGLDLGYFPGGCTMVVRTSLRAGLNGYIHDRM